MPDRPCMACGAVHGINEPHAVRRPRIQAGETQKAEQRSPKPKDAGSIPATRANPRPLGPMAKTSDFDSENIGSTPVAAAKLNGYARLKRWRQKHRDQYNADQRQRRAKLKEPK